MPPRVIVLNPGERPHALRAGTRKRIHIRGAAIRACEAGDPQPCIVIRTVKGDFEAHDIDWNGHSKLVERIENPLPDGTRIWIETRAEVRVIR